jgi:hypothetical protein
MYGFILHHIVVFILLGRLAAFHLGRERLDFGWREAADLNLMLF